MLVTYVFNDSVNVGYSGYYGDDSLKGNHLLMAHNAFLNFKGKKIKVTVGGDYITQQNSSISIPQKTASMWSAVLILSYNFTEKFRAYNRVEEYSDPNGLLSGVFMDEIHKFTGLKLWGTTAGIEFKPVDKAYIRLEGRVLIADHHQKIFRWNNENRSQRWEAMINFGVWF